jgi:Na+/melibiose symporter-like transporter
MFWMCVYFVMTIGMQLFLGGINELFSSTGLNMTFVMASSFAPVPLTLMLYNRIVKRRGLAVAFRVTLAIYSVGMLVMYLCSIFSTSLTELQLTLIAIFGGILVSFSLGSFFSVPYTVPTHLAQVEFNRSGNGVASMYFAVDGLFGGVASGIATGVILVALKSINNISLLPIIVIICMMTAFCLTFFLPDTIKNIGKGEK